MTNDYDAERTRQEAFAARLDTLCTYLTLTDGQLWIANNRDRDGQPRRESAELTSTAGDRLFLRIDGYQMPGRLSVSGTYGPMPDGQQWLPRDYQRDAVNPTATISQAKTDQQIAADICRRILPGYRAHRAAYSEALAQAMLRRNGTRATVDALIEAGNGLVRDLNEYQRQEIDRQGQATLHMTRGTLRVSGADSIQLDLYLTLAQTRQLLALLALQAADQEGSNQ